mmetsp:Transcript_16978/g.22028  ORF Transcript_16978/g.22028 Transcript_16978/m.22028 type:complete len:189 (+) Transcript_16978:110-676(+)
MPSIAVLTTSMGVFEAELYTEVMPVTCGNFIDLANSGFYDGIHFHRVIPDFMCQFGCPYAKDPTSKSAGTGGPDGYTTFRSCDDQEYKRTSDGGIEDEIGKKEQMLTNAVGTLSMANTGQPKSGGSQFFINTSNNSFLDWFDRQTESAHPVFGKVVKGLDVVEKISRVRTNRDDNPIQPVKMISIRVK